jgi:hypothetical protein
VCASRVLEPDLTRPELKERDRAVGRLTLRPTTAVKRLDPSRVVRNATGLKVDSPLSDATMSDTTTKNRIRHDLFGGTALLNPSHHHRDETAGPLPGGAERDRYIEPDHTSRGHKERRPESRHLARRSVGA